MKNYCGADCSVCDYRGECRGCVETCGKPFGKECVAAECIKAGGETRYNEFKSRLMDELNGLGIADMPPVTELYLLRGAYVNLEYTLPGGQKTRLLDDDRIYLGCQQKKAVGDRCYGIVADSGFLLVCEYGCEGADPEIVIFKERRCQSMAATHRVF